MIKLKDYLPDKVYWPIRNFYDNRLNPFYQKSYAQEGEDLVVNALLHEKTKGFYIDVGAHHPKRFSNTYFFYKLGWQGINIEPRPGSKTIFDRIRPRDINLEVPISLKEKELTYYIFNEPAINGFDKQLAEERDGKNGYKLIDKKKLVAKPLKRILAENLPNTISIDFMSIDVEGMDLEVLESNDWSKFRPGLILVEDSNFNPCECESSKIYKFLSAIDYKFISKTFRTTFYMSL